MPGHQQGHQRKIEFPHSDSMARAFAAGKFALLIKNNVPGLSGVLPEQIPRNVRNGSKLESIKDGQENWVQLTDEEVAVAKDTIHGKSISDIVDSRGLGRSTVARYMMHARDYTGARTNPHLVRRFVELGYVANLSSDRLPSSPDIVSADRVVLGLLSLGIKQEEIAALAGISQGNISYSMSKVYEGMGLPTEKRDSVSAVTMGFATGLLAPETGVLPPQYPIPPEDFVLAGMRAMVGMRSKGS